MPELRDRSIPGVFQRPLALPAASGTYRGATTLVSVGLEVALP